MKEIFYWILIGIAVPLIIALALHTIRRAKALATRIDDFHDSTDSSQNQPDAIINPYGDMASIFGHTPDDGDGEKRS